MIFLMPFLHHSRPSDDKAGLLVPRITDDREIPAFQLVDGVPESRVVLSVPHGITVSAEPDNCA